MKRKMLMLLVVLLTLSFCSIASAASWVYLDTNTDMKIYIDDDRMDAFQNKYGEFIIDYWLATVLTPDGKYKLLQYCREAGTYQYWMEEMDYMVIHIKTNVDTKQENQIMVYAYANGKNGSRLLNSEQGFVRDIEPGTNSEWWNARVAQYYLKKIERNEKRQPPRGTNL